MTYLIRIDTIRVCEPNEISELVEMSSISDPELQEELTIVTPSLIREMSCYISSLGGRIAQIQPDAIEGGTQTGPEMIALIINALIKRCCIDEEKGAVIEAEQLGKINQILCSALYYQELLYNRDNNDESNEGDALDLLISQIDDPDQIDILFSGGWKGHAIMYGVHKNPDKHSYTFRIWNTGKGLKHHLNSSGKYAIRAEWTGLSYAQISDPKFLRELFRFKSKKIEKSDEVYQFINSHFKCNRSSDMSGKKQYRHEQKYNNCEWKCIWAAVSDLLRDINLVLPFEIKKDAIKLLRKELLEKILPKSSKPIDAHLIETAKGIESDLLLKIESHKIRMLHRTRSTH